MAKTFFYLFDSFVVIFTSFVVAEGGKEETGIYFSFFSLGRVSVVPVGPARLTIFHSRFLEENDDLPLRFFETQQECCFGISFFPRHRTLVFRCVAIRGYAHARIRRRRPPFFFFSFSQGKEEEE